MTAGKKRVTDRVRETPRDYGPPRKISATEASRSFSELLNRAKYRGESFIIERGGEPICEIRPAAPTRFTGRDLVSLLSSLPPVDAGYLESVESAIENQPRLPGSPWER
ncbi:MAG: type II toxin-antitoxin system Phd/YefM family antitoxin [Acidobacteria bacterium]|nr:MAG: type II toxin-antitoxin system Phd/YefM family antitoxin [Acidobacteriota bacterium]